ncbi:MAG: transmembrane anchor protein [Desulfobacterales bacterium]|nr:transmembrane anchor protein [Desulfobacterales bacterium]
MYNSNIPTDRELPSTRKLIKSTLFALTAAVVLLITTVLPAEYGIDPTGIGNAIGLKKMGEIKVSLANEVAADNAGGAQLPVQQPAVKEQQTAAVTADVAQTMPEKPMVQDTISVTLKPNQGAEVKTRMRKGDTLRYTWSTDGGRANFDVHGDSRLLNINYHNYEKGSQKIKEGAITAAFDGSHGWFWRNRTSETLTVALQVSGEFDKLVRVK